MGNREHSDRRRTYGDYQTPLDFCRRVCQLLQTLYHDQPRTVLEPTCGVGNFLVAAAETWPLVERLCGLETNEAYATEARNRLSKIATPERLMLVCGDFFSFETTRLRQWIDGKNASGESDGTSDFHRGKSAKSERGPIWIVGNPPWVMSDTLSGLNAANPVPRSNFKRAKGLEAITGSANFDLCESVILRLLEAFDQTDTLVAMLCKTSVARSVFREMVRRRIQSRSVRLFRFDARRVFGITADAGLLTIQLVSQGEKMREEQTENPPTRSDLGRDSCGNRENPSTPCGAEAYKTKRCEVYDFERPTVPTSVFGFRDERFYAELDADADAEYLKFDGSCCFEWRQGIKHDCAKVMELEREDASISESEQAVPNGKGRETSNFVKPSAFMTYRNGLDETVELEEEYLFPLVKSSDFRTAMVTRFRKWIVVTQRKVGESTARIESTAPATWRYLMGHTTMFEKRKSVIYRHSPPFSIFGVGEYSFSRFKVGVSGFYKTPKFCLLTAEKPVMLDDTGYFLPFDQYNLAYTTMLLLNESHIQRFLQCVSFRDAKRPWTKAVLSRIDFSKCIDHVNVTDLIRVETTLELEPRVNEAIFAEFRAAVWKRPKHTD